MPRKFRSAKAQSLSRHWAWASWWPEPDNTGHRALTFWGLLSPGLLEGKKALRLLGFLEI